MRMRVAHRNHRMATIKIQVFYAFKVIYIRTTTSHRLDLVERIYIE